jgi:N-acetylneuraminic acid mutarotase
MRCLVATSFLVYGCFVVSQYAFIEFPESQIDRKPLSFEERVECQKSIQEVYWRHTVWPASNPQPKPTLETVLPISEIRAKTKEYIRKSNELSIPITNPQLNAEVERITHETAAPEILRELQSALGNDPYLFAECLARPTLIIRTAMLAVDPIAAGLHTAVWTGSHMIVWGGNSAAALCCTFQYGDYIRGGELNSGAIYDPATNSWKLIPSQGAPEPRNLHTAVWTGTEMVVWGGHDFVSGVGDQQYITGGRYNPFTDSWKPVTINGAPEARDTHTAVWTGKEMIIWGGVGGTDLHILDSGGRYNPAKDSWKAVRTGVPRWAHTAIWTGKEMIVWGGRSRPGGICCDEVDTGERYNAKKNSWKSVTTTGAPSARAGHTAVWRGTEMIIWGGGETFDGIPLNTGGHYNPRKNLWQPITLTKAPKARLEHKAVWTGTEMIIWGGLNNAFALLKTGSRYDPLSDSWTAPKSKRLLRNVNLGRPGELTEFCEYRRAV